MLDVTRLESSTYSRKSKMAGGTTMAQESTDDFYGYILALFDFM